MANSIEAAKTWKNVRLVRVERNIRSFDDRRKKVDWWLYSHVKNGEEYRGAIETAPGSTNPLANTSFTN